MEEFHEVEWKEIHTNELILHDSTYTVYTKYIQK